MHIYPFFVIARLNFTFLLKQIKVRTVTITKIKYNFLPNFQDVPLNISRPLNIKSTLRSKCNLIYYSQTDYGFTQRRGITLHSNSGDGVREDVKK